MRILYLGDIVGENMISVLERHLPELKQEYKVNLVLANAENVTSGKGLSEKHYKQLKSLGIAGFSMGNHTFSKKEIFDYMDKPETTLCIPANIPCKVGKKVLYIKYNDKVIALVNMMGRVYQNTPLDDPFKTMDNLLESIKADHIIVDFHADATSEKKAFFYDFSGKVDAVLGSHTHTQTSDEMVYNNTCFITDMGMVGDYNSILGDDMDMVIERFRSGVFQPLKVAKTGVAVLGGVVLDLNGNKNTIERILKKYNY